MKRCRTCFEEKPLSEFYRHAGMADGHLNYCKECKRGYALKYREKNIERIREYDRARGNRQTREYTEEYRERNPEKYAAHTAVNNAVRDGKLKREPCERCGSDRLVHAHHDDYSKPLDVRWLCPSCHGRVHGKSAIGKHR